MRKLRALIAFFLVILTLITPWPLGLRPANALPTLAPLAVTPVGALIAVGAGAALYFATSPFVESDIQPNSSGFIDRSVIQGVKLSQDVVYGIRDFFRIPMQPLADAVNSSPSDYPALAGPIANSQFFPEPGVGSVFSMNGTKKRISSILVDLSHYIMSFSSPVQTLSEHLVSTGWSVIEGGYIKWTGTYFTLLYRTEFKSIVVLGGVSYHNYDCYFKAVTIEDTNLPLPLPVLNPDTLAQNIPKTESAAHDLDKFAERNPGAITKPAPLTRGQIEAAGARAKAVAAQEKASIATEQAALNPGVVSWQIAAEEAQAEAEVLAIEADTKESLINIEESKETTPDIPYIPTGLSGPYTLPDVDFGLRFEQFVNSVKSSSLFSLPNTVFGGVPFAGSSVLTINGGQIFGTHNFDFADMSSLWMVLRGIVLTGFSFIAVRVVSLKR